MKQYPHLLAVLNAKELPRFLGLDLLPLNLNEAQIQAIEDALAASNADALANAQEELKALTQSLEEVKAQKTDADTRLLEVNTAMKAALELNGLQATDNLSEGIALLGSTCKAYGDSRPTHTLPQSNGKENTDENGLIDGYIDPEALHNKFLEDL